MLKTKKGRSSFSTISLPTPLIEKIERILDELGYWPMKTDFIRDAVTEKLERYKRELEDRRRAEKLNEDAIVLLWQKSF